MLEQIWNQFERKGQYLDSESEESDGNDEESHEITTNENSVKEDDVVSTSSDDLFSFSIHPKWEETLESIQEILFAAYDSLPRDLFDLVRMNTAERIDSLVR